MLEFDSMVIFQVSILPGARYLAEEYTWLIQVG